MREYSNKIALIKNSRGVYSLDVSMGCASGMKCDKGGCYNECYAAKSAKLYGYDFSKTVLRHFENKHHLRDVLNKINRAKLDFIRIGQSGDPSEDWQHTISILKKIDKCNKEIVIITKHWNNLTEDQLQYLLTINVCINTSVSALDKIELLNNRLEQYNKLKKYCKSVLRIVSCDFNLQNKEGERLAKIQDELFKNDATLDTVFRTNKRNKLVRDGIINTCEQKFLGKKSLASKFNKSVYFDKCSTCFEQCGINITPEEVLYPKKKGITKQLFLFKHIIPI